MVKLLVINVKYHMPQNKVSDSIKQVTLYAFFDCYFYTQEVCNHLAICLCQVDKIFIVGN